MFIRLAKNASLISQKIRIYMEVVQTSVKCKIKLFLVQALQIQNLEHILFFKWHEVIKDTPSYIPWAFDVLYSLCCYVSVLGLQEISNNVLLYK